MSRTTVLLGLQRLDLQRDHAERRRREIEAQLADTGRLETLRSELAAAERSVAEIDRQLRLLDMERHGLKERITSEERSLYDGPRRSPKELQSIQREVQSLKRRLEELDDRALEQMLARDEVVALRDGKRQELAKLEEEVAQQRQSLGREKDALGAKSARFQAERARLAATIPEPDLALYERLRQTKGGRAVAVVGPEGCTECGIELPRHTRDRAKGGSELVLCPGCGRILHG